MASLTVDDFKIGKDSRKGPSVADADRLIELKNAYINRGKVPRKRPGSSLDATLETGSAGLLSANDLLNTFYGKGALTHADLDYKANLVNATVEHPAFTGGAGPPVGELDDLTTEGEFNGVSAAAFDVRIHAVKNFAITVFADSPSAPGVRTQVTATGHTFGNSETLEIEGTTSYNGDQLVSEVGANVFDIPVVFVANDATGTAENSTWKFQKDGGGFGAPITIVPATALSLSDGIDIQFPTAGDGRTADDKWLFNGIFYNNIKTIHYADVFLGFIYVVVEYNTGLVRHHYLDGAINTVIKDTNCPHTKGVIKMEGKIWAVNGDTVNFSATDEPRDWTTALDAGFLSTGLKQRNADNALALGQYGTHGLVVIHNDGAQLWTVDPDPTLHVYEKSLDGFASRFNRAVRQFGGDLFILSDGGVRSVSEQVFSDNIQEQDVGSPIDKEIKAVLTNDSDVFAARFNKLGQFWLVIDGNVFVYTFSRTQKISAWSEYSYPFTIDYLEEFRGDLYMREGDKVYLVDEKLFQDDGVAFEAEIQTAFLNAKSPGLDKMWWGMDSITTGEAEISMRYDPNNALSETTSYKISGDTTPGQITPIEVVSPSLSFIFKNKLNEEFQLDSFTAHFTELKKT